MMASDEPGTPGGPTPAARLAAPPASGLAPAAATAAPPGARDQRYLLVVATYTTMKQAEALQARLLGPVLPDRAAGGAGEPAHHLEDGGHREPARANKPLILVGLALLVNGQQARASIEPIMAFDDVFAELSVGDVDSALEWFAEDATAENKVRAETYRGTSEIRKLLAAKEFQRCIDVGIAE